MTAWGGGVSQGVGYVSRSRFGSRHSANLHRFGSRHCANLQWDPNHPLAQLPWLCDKGCTQVVQSQNLMLLFLFPEEVN